MQSTQVRLKPEISEALRKQAYLKRSSISEQANLYLATALLPTNKAKAK